jgi:nucleoside-diphosphate-sugar epimerase
LTKNNRINILVTGGAGNVGSALVKRLAEIKTNRVIVLLSKF